jgi:sterol 3beta-glucosyltransferase
MFIHAEEFMKDSSTFHWPPEYRRNLARRKAYRFAALLWGSRGDVQPFIALGGELVRRGHSVVIAARERFRRLAEEQGVELHPMPEDGTEEFMKAMAQARGVPDMLPLSASYSRGILQTQFAGFEEAGRGADVILTKAISTMPALHLAEWMGVPVFLVHIDPGFIPSDNYCMAGDRFADKGGLVNRLMSHMMLTVFSLTVADRINAWRIRRRLAPDPLARRNHAARLFRLPAFAVWSPRFLPRPANWPEWYVQTGWWQLPRRQAPDPRLRDFVLFGPPPLYFGFGSWDVHDKHRATDVILEALAATGDRAVLLRDTVDADRTYPLNVLLVDNVPHDWLFPRVKAAVYHGGAGTTGAVTTAGAPSILIPAFAAQIPWGHLVTERGIGTMLDRHGLTGGKLAEAIRRVGGPGVAERARRFADSMRAEGGVEQAADEIERRLEEAVRERKIRLVRRPEDLTAVFSRSRRTAVREPVGEDAAAAPLGPGARDPRGDDDSIP